MDTGGLVISKVRRPPLRPGTVTRSFLIGARDLSLTRDEASLLLGLIDR